LITANDRAVVLDAVDEHALDDPDLRRGEADAVCSFHHIAHPVDLLSQLRIEARHGQRPRLQYRIAELADLRRRRVASRALLRRELLGGGRLLSRLCF